MTTSFSVCIYSVDTFLYPYTLPLVYHPFTSSSFCLKCNLSSKLSVVATTHYNSTRSMLTSAKLSVGYLVVGITRELDKESSLHCSSIYINTTWSVLQQYLPTLMSMYCPHVLLLIHHKATMLYTCTLMSYS